MAVVVFRRTTLGFCGRRRVDFGHPLAQGLVGAWVPNPDGLGTGNGTWGMAEVIFGQDPLIDMQAGTPTVKRVTMSGPGLAGPARTGVMSSRLRLNAGTIFWTGTITANIAGSGAGYLAGTSYNASNSSPFDAMTIIRPSGDSTSIRFGYNDGASPQNVTVASMIASTDYGNPLSFAATFGVATVHGYKNGRQIGSAARVGTTIAYDAATAGFSINGTYRADIFSANPNSITTLALIWNRELTATDHLLLAVNPFQIFDAGRLWASTSAAAAAVAHMRRSIAPFGTRIGARQFLR